MFIWILLLLLLLLLTGKPSDGAEQAHVSVMELTSYIQKLRDFLPVATVAMRDHLGGKLTQEEEACLEEDTAEDYVTELMDRALLADWDKLSPKVHMLT